MKLVLVGLYTVHFKKPLRFGNEDSWAVLEGYITTYTRDTVRLVQVLKPTCGNCKWLTFHDTIRMCHEPVVNRLCLQQVYEGVVNFTKASRTSNHVTTVSQTVGHKQLTTALEYINLFLSMPKCVFKLSSFNCLYCIDHISP